MSNRCCSASSDGPSRPHRPCADIPVALRRRRGLRRGDAHRPQGSPTSDRATIRATGSRSSLPPTVPTIAPSPRRGPRVQNRCSTCLGVGKIRALVAAVEHAARRSARVQRRRLPIRARNAPAAGLELCRRLGRSGGGERGARRRPRRHARRPGRGVCTGATRTGSGAPRIGSEASSRRAVVSSRCRASSSVGRMQRTPTISPFPRR